MENYDVIIIGAGPAGLTTALYASRGNLKVLILEKGAPGGKLVSQSKIENWPGDEIIDGATLALRMYKHPLKFGAKHRFCDVDFIETENEFDHKVYCKDGKIFQARAVVVASGMVERKPLDIKYYLEYEGRGVSYCVVCDGPFYANQPAIVIGGGNSAVEEGSFLASIASKVYILVRDSQFNAEPMLIEDLKKNKNVEIWFNAKVLELRGKDQLESALIDHNGEKKVLEIKSLFPYIGFLPATKFLEKNHRQALNQINFIDVDSYGQTKIPGIYAVGDVVSKEIRQIVTAASDGAIVGKILTNRIK
ncbi:FAD-binding protein [Mesomycoplasma hyopneumoniae]|uniref:NAD(P)/FAD-dependent oxidoreductase n=1 Tax=Mesomycoplasma hyopneumoniae TaxID=2099 RepID=UPI0011B42497|nr:FAD-dependent oxidoreductase [Mesomycoplasma hyopneumoniae]MXR11138.1 FAD-dependent oxidoreductase [Mesomycoplasma hyopneumoniae]MXR34529.1 FAD-dependent oxidoreductase [Mesomycoplasma hyopneumoniae]MXR57450.1 FAD-dependent oxidoreductase [Mesomycoplasma hyopneumoniae]MXR64093.1 FAD-dependent oxidoreductase [Mesomycoplasma hyopneumoniae]NYN92027.1 FAD-dependent oxidoreductase [Mesomycoplasma hyopneumoniae]